MCTPLECCCYKDNSTSLAKDKVRALLLEGFEEPMRERGLVYCKWAPHHQQQILCHPSTRGFLSHCGWSSVLEALRFWVKIRI
ncbi:hypothetical protein SUGI_0417530 [Cryptomeria japonica]|nr:hypothetical protein SUGI_0417530 [Cryptomeria japonica]